MSIQIVTDSTCDLPEKTISKLNITVLPLNIHIGENAYKDGIDISREEFYRQLPGLHPFPKTASPGPGGFQKLYQALAEKGAKAILSIHISESLSATVNEARIAAEQFTRIPVTVLDSTQLTLGTGYLVETAATLAAAGQTLEEILSTLKEQMQRSYVFASLKTLEYLRRSGRMHSAVAHIGEILKIKPVLYMNMGKPIVHRTRTQKNATAQMMGWLEEYAPFEQLAIVHAGIQEEAEALKESVRKYWPERDVPVIQITPALGAHLGIGAMGFACVSKK
ncbi:MAG: DegV family protein [Anaerolineales bacterium]|jgi:DegV family protein with EDD domain|nr:DegV family protein [Anaerolineales bacterium]